MRVSLHCHHTKFVGATKVVIVLAGSKSRFAHQKHVEDGLFLMTRLRESCVYPNGATSGDEEPEEVQRC